MPSPFEAPRGKLRGIFNVRNFFFFCLCSLADPAARPRGLWALCIFGSPRKREIPKCKECLILSRVRSFISHKAAGIALAMHFPSP